MALAIPKAQAKKQLQTLQQRAAAGTGGPNTAARIAALTPAPVAANTPVTVPRAGSNFKVGTTLAELEAQKAKLKPGATNRLGMVNSAIAGLTPQAAPPAVTPPPADVIPNGMGNENPTDPNDLAHTLFPSTRMFEPENYEGSPLYQFQVQQGQKQLGRSLAKRGLTNSGYGIEEELNIPLRAAAQDTDRMTRVASENADRLKSFMDNEALRTERAGNAQWDRQFNLTELMSRQSPWAAALAGLNNTADITSDAGQSQANFLKDYYQRIMAGGGGGSGGSGGGGIPLSLPSGPDYSNISPTQIGGDYSSNSGWLNLLAKGLSNIF